MQRQSTPSRAALSVAASLAVLVAGLACGAEGRHPAVEWANHRAKFLADRAIAWYQKTPSDERVAYGGLGAAALFGLVVAAERTLRVRRGRIVPGAYLKRFHARLIDGQLDRGKALDYCELYPSPAARVALAAIRRWGRPASDLERGVALARQTEVDQLRRHIGTLRRIAALAPLVGLLGSLMATGRVLAAGGGAWGPTLAQALGPLTAGVTLAILSLVCYDGLAGRVEALAAALDRIGAETVDAIALATPFVPAAQVPPAPASARRTHFGRATGRAEIPIETD